jgi:hypothetical protein
MPAAMAGSRSMICFPPQRETNRTNGPGVEATARTRNWAAARQKLGSALPIFVTVFADAAVGKRWTHRPAAQKLAVGEWQRSVDRSRPLHRRSVARTSSRTADSQNPSICADRCRFAKSAPTLDFSTRSGLLSLGFRDPKGGQFRRSSGCGPGLCFRSPAASKAVAIRLAERVAGENSPGRGVLPGCSSPPRTISEDLQ